MDHSIQLLLIWDEGDERENIADRLTQLDVKCDVQRVGSFENLKEHTNLSDFDVIVCDFNFANYNGIEVLFYVREREHQLPFIFISDAVWEEATIDTLILNGVSDYVQSNQLKELEFVIRREVNRYHHIRNTQMKLKVSEHRFRNLVQSINGILRVIDLETLKIVYVSPQSMNILGYPASDWVENEHFWLQQIHPKDRIGIINRMNEVFEGHGNHTIEYRMINSEGDTVWIRDLLSIRKENGEPVRLDGLMIDITNEKEIEYQRDVALHNENKRMKEQKCLWNITHLDEQDFTIHQLLQRAMMLIPIGFQYPKWLGVCVEFGEEEFVSSNYEETEVMISAKNLKLEEDNLIIRVNYLDNDILQESEDAFLEDEQHLLDTICDILAVKIAKKKSTESLKKHEQLLINTYELAQLGQII